MSTTTTWTPTHKITFRGTDGDEQEWTVMLVEGAGYTEDDWREEQAADWCVVDGDWLCEGRVTPCDLPGTVEVEELDEQSPPDDAADVESLRLIAESISHTTTAHGTYSKALHESLLVDCADDCDEEISDGSAEPGPGETVTYWGTTDAGAEWRVVLEVPR